MQPSGQDNAVRQGRRLARQVDKHGLGHVLGQVVIAVNQPERRGVNQTNVPPDQFAESFVGAISHILLQQLFVAGRHLSTY
jgi:hypothetical protein